MFDVGFTELILLFILGLLVLGPEKLPRVASQLGRWFGQARRVATNFQRELEREVALQNLREHTTADASDSADASHDEAGDRSDDPAPHETPSNETSHGEYEPLPDGAPDEAASDPPVADTDQISERQQG